MKKAFLILSGLLVVVACDKVTHPMQNEAVACTLNPNDTVVRTNKAKSDFRKVLIEDYTGHRCGFCPGAARKLETLEGQYKDSVIGIAVHAGSQFAPPKLPEFPEDFRTTAGTDWDNFFGCSALGLPKGLINRVNIPPYAQPHTNWPSLVSTHLHKPQSTKLDITTYFDVKSLFLNVDVKATFKTAQTNDVWLCMVIVEDSIHAHQIDYNPVSTSCIFNGDIDSCYHFNATLRGAVNSSWGQLLKAGPVAVNDTVSIKVTCFKVTNVINTKNINPIAFAYNYLSKEVLQVEKIHLR